MGVFDSVYAECPHCEMETIEFQSKAGDPYMQRYPVNAVPTTIAADINGNEASCSVCGRRYAAVAPLPKTVAIGLRRTKVS